MQREYLESWPVNDWSPGQIQGPHPPPWEYLYPRGIAVVEERFVECERMDLYGN